MFMLSGAISWVGKQAQLSANPVSLGEGWWLITQAITRRMHQPMRAWTSSLHSTCINTIQLQQSRPVSMTSKPPNSCCMMGGAQMWPQDSVPRMRSGTTVRLTLRPGAMRVAGNPTSISFPPCQIMDLRVIKVQCQLLHQCH